MKEILDQHIGKLACIMVGENTASSQFGQLQAVYGQYAIGNLVFPLEAVKDARPGEPTETNRCSLVIEVFP